jgi:hypothetical protein
MARNGITTFMQKQAAQLRPDLALEMFFSADTATAESAIKLG